MSRTNPGDLLFGAYRRQVLGFLLPRPEEDFHVREIARLTGVPAGSLHRELRQLEQAGLLRRTEQGNQVRYGADARSPVYHELAGLLRKTAEPASTLHSPQAAYVVRGASLQIPKLRLARICRRYGVKKLSLFGSAARGELRADSDVDLLVEFAPESRTTLFDLPRMQDELSALFGNRRVDIATPEILENPHRRRAILPDLKVLYVA